MNFILIKESLKLFKRCYFACIFTATGRTRFIYKHKNLFQNVGKKLFWQPRKFPPQPELISLGDNVNVASGVEFVTHDIISLMLNKKYGGKEFADYIAPIKIDDNVMIGANTMIMPGVHICSDVIVAAGSIVAKDIALSGVWGGGACKAHKVI